MISLNGVRQNKKPGEFRDWSAPLSCVTCLPQPWRSLSRSFLATVGAKSKRYVMLAEARD